MSRSGTARALSLSAAGVLATILMLTPQIFGLHISSGVAHGSLSLAMLGMTGAFVHGFGFRPDHVSLRLLFSPWISWALMAGGLWFALVPVQSAL